MLDTLLLLATFANMTAAAKPPTDTNPVSAPWVGPYGGVPPFDKVKVDDLKPAIEAAMAAQLKEVDAIATQKAPATFENTIVAMEKTGQSMNRSMAVFGVFSGNLATPEFQKVESELSPKLAAHQDAVFQNAALFARIKAVYESKAKAKLSPEQQRLTWYYWNQFVLNGANLDATQKAKLGELNQQLAKLTTQFSQNQLGDEEKEALVVERATDLNGMSESAIAAAATEAERRGMKGKWVIANTRSAMEPLLTYCNDRSVREKAFKLWTRRGDMGNERDNNALVSQILLLRAQKAKLLGYSTYAHWKLSDTMAKDPEQAMSLMTSVWQYARDQFKKDVLEAQTVADAEGAKFKIAPWDYRYYAEKLRKKKYDLDFSLVRPYLQLEHVREAMFFMAQELYGLSFTKISGVPVFDPEMSVYEVKRGKEHVGLWYFDPYARQGKRSGAWMTAYRDQQRCVGKLSTLVSNNSNFIRGKAGEPVTLSWDDARTMFHEFGHALHGLNSNVTYASLSGTNVARDFVEFPSQFHEHYLMTPQVLKFLVNEKGEAIPKELLERIEKARAFNSGFATAEAQASAIVDMKLHLAGETAIDPKAFEKATLAELGMPGELVMRHRIPAFGHLFSGDGYAAGYYSYIWSEVLDHDTYEAFSEGAGPYDKAVASRLLKTVMSVGNTVEPAAAFRNFRGRDPQPQALLKSKGFVTAAAPKAP